MLWEATGSRRERGANGPGTWTTSFSHKVETMRAAKTPLMYYSVFFLSSTSLGINLISRFNIEALELLKTFAEVASTEPPRSTSARFQRDTCICSNTAFFFVFFFMSQGCWGKFFLRRKCDSSLDSAAAAVEPWKRASFHPPLKRAHQRVSSASISRWNRRLLDMWQ